jgi:hypothetical protein
MPVRSYAAVRRLMRCQHPPAAFAEADGRQAARRTCALKRISSPSSRKQHVSPERQHQRLAAAARHLQKAAQRIAGFAADRARDEAIAFKPMSFYMPITTGRAK